MIVKRIQKSGQANFFYLPQKWISDFGVKPGDYVNITDSPFGELVVSPVSTKRVTEKIELSIVECDLKFLNRLIYGCFISGFDSFVINIQKPFNRDELLADKRKLDLRIDGVEIVDISNNRLELNFSSETSAVMPLFKNFLGKAENYMSAVRYNDTKLSDHYGIELDTSRFQILRSINKSLRSVSSDLPKNTAVVIMQLVNNINDVVSKDEVAPTTVGDYDLIIEVIRLLKSDFDNLSFKTIQKLDLLLDRFKSKTARFLIKYVDRLLINYYLNKIVKY